MESDREMCKWDPVVHTVPTSETISNGPVTALAFGWLAKRIDAWVRLPTHVITYLTKIYHHHWKIIITLKQLAAMIEDSDELEPFFFL